MLLKPQCACGSQWSCQWIFCLHGAKPRFEGLHFQQACLMLIWAEDVDFNERVRGTKTKFMVGGKGCLSSGSQTLASEKSTPRPPEERSYEQKGRDSPKRQIQAHRFHDPKTWPLPGRRPRHWGSWADRCVCLVMPSSCWYKESSIYESIQSCRLTPSQRLRLLPTSLKRAPYSYKAGFT